MITEGMGWFVCCVRTWIGTDNCQRRAMRKTKSVHGSGCGWGDGFSEKRKSRNISLPSILSHRPSHIITATVTVLLSIDHRELTLPNIGFMMFFLTAKTTFIRWLPRAFLALLHGLFFLSLPLRHITPWHFWHFGIMKCARVQGVHGGNYWNIRWHRCTFCIFCTFKFQNADNAGYADVFSFHRPIIIRFSLIYNTPYWTKPEYKDDDRWKKEEPSDVGRRVLKVPKCQKCHGVNHGIA